MPKKDIEWGESEQGVEGGVINDERETPKPSEPSRSNKKSRKSGRRSKA